MSSDDEGLPATAFDDRIDEAMQRCADGSEEAYAQVYRLMGPRLLAWFRRQGAGPELAEDLLQEVALRLYRARGNFQRGASAMAWAYGIARNAYIDHVRATRARPQATDDDRELAQLRADDHDAADRSVLEGEQSRQLREAVARLPSNQRRAFEMRHLEQLDIPQAARRAGVTENALKIRVHRALESLRHAFDHDEDDERRR